jgi:hypothetical protein
MTIAKYFVICAVATLAAGAEAQTVEIAGDASGKFSNGSSVDYGGLFYLGSTFDVFTAGGFYALGGNAAIPNMDNLGSFTLSTSAFNYSSPPATFTEYITFTKPSTIVGGQNTTYIAPLTGQVIDSNTGGVFIDFGSSPHVFDFSTPGGKGVFTLSINPLSIYPGQTESLTGYGTAEIVPVPAPGAIACMACGLIGTWFRRRRRR